MATRRETSNFKRYGFTFGTTTGFSDTTAGVAPETATDGSSTDANFAVSELNATITTITDGGAGNMPVVVTVWYDNSGYHTLPAALNVLNNARLQRLLGSAQASITAASQPIAFKSSPAAKIAFGEYVGAVVVSLLLLVALSALCSYCSGRAVHDSSSSALRLYCTLGLPLRLYWISALLWDGMMLVVTVLLLVVVLLIFGQPHFVGGDNLPAFLLICLLYGCSMLPLFYLLGRFFCCRTSATVSFFFTAVGVGFLASVVVMACQAYSWVQSGKVSLGCHEASNILFFTIKFFCLGLILHLLNVSLWASSPRSWSWPARPTPGSSIHLTRLWASCSRCGRWGSCCSGPASPCRPTPSAPPSPTSPSPTPGYVAPTPGYVAPTPGYVAPTPGYVAPTPGYVAPTPGYVAPTPGYVAPTPGYVAPTPGYVAPTPGYVAPTPGYVAPTPGYVAPTPGYVAPTPGYVAPTPGYVAPTPGYVAPTPGYVAPTPGYVAPTPGYVAPTPGYVAPPKYT
ncbi:uncharacterized protein LOC125178117 [Hyalella azteca]|uniref:Uncharacterized protein LOC125178117 n=1 Tax=Hyalella azteca TaxID=294128 RepID=A0A979FK95_HYAAZ|nr:uncharacterized protein LOC125178117 [Hyalella azteca]